MGPNTRRPDKRLGKNGKIKKSKYSTTLTHICINATPTPQKPAA
jgi:hypothetical protein